MEQIFAFDTKTLTYVLGTDDDGRLFHLYWGKKIKHSDFSVDELNDANSNHSDLDGACQEYTVFGGKMYRNCAFKCTYFDGCRDALYTYKSHIESENELVIMLQDKAYGTELVLHFVHYSDSDVITRYVECCNNSADDVKVDKFMSCEVNLPGLEPYYIQNTNGSWGGEFQVKTEKLLAGYLVFDSRKGSPLFLTIFMRMPAFLAQGRIMR